MSKLWIKYLPLCILLLVLGGCVTDGVSPTALQPICGALVGPIRYNTYVKTSARYSGAALAADLKLRNNIGRNIGCPLYR
jgi:hypothetical protein